jgi:hypothetical protein
VIIKVVLDLPLLKKALPNKWKNALSLRERE